MSLAYFGRRYTFSAAHRLHTDALSVAENRAAYGKCNNPHGHGHNYTVEVLCGGRVHAATGMVINMSALDEIVRRVVVERFDHMNLNFDAIFEKEVPTTENLTIAVFDLLAGELKQENVKLDKVRIEETENNFFEYSGVQ
jgi:6-pyruvoyltetrahydropterin/6-carboxytetrahydropterin synthase